MHWALQYGYGEYSDTQLQQVLARSNEAELVYGNDADDMRSSGNGIDPHINIYDLSSDAIGYAEMRLAHLRTVQDRLPQQYEGKSYQGLVNAFASLMSQYRRSGGVVSRYVGGVHINRQPPNSVETLPYTPVDVGEQRRAMQVLNTHLFAPDVLVGARSVVCPAAAGSDVALIFTANRKIRKFTSPCFAYKKACFGIWCTQIRYSGLPIPKPTAVNTLLSKC